ncbi:MAG: crossover junction endodeoxyribonuclease RuvC, partial [Chloroflexota bacterium]
MKSKDKERIILGIDPGTTITGYAVIKCSGINPELVTLGAMDLSKLSDHYLKLKHIFERTTGIIDEYHPDELAIEAPFYGKNVQSMLKLGRAQGA